MTTKIRRCAVYTRKSSEEGLDQTFNSLDAQREACEAYIKSQAHEGWKLVKTPYDDGGFSGGNLERPALQRLLVDLARGQVDVVVVYKIDRLTRSLADFARIVETLDRQGASFVSITQQFNTTTSMGRLTLNVLLSFAQFEREVTGERIRDKIAASKRNGMWMGGNLPLGYDVKDRQLVVNEAEAQTVRMVFARYLELGRVSDLLAELRQRGIVSKVWISSKGVSRGGYPYSRGALYYLLRNSLYIGRIAHFGASHPGQHTGIVDQEVWDRVQASLTENRHGVSRAATASVQCLLAGRLFDDRGNLMSPSHSRKANGRRYRYYVSQAVLQGQTDNAGTIRRVSAEAIESLVECNLCAGLSKTKQMEWASLSVEQKCQHIARLVERTTIFADSVEIKLTEVGCDLVSVNGAHSGLMHIATTMKAGLGGRQIVPHGSTASTRVDRSLVKAIARAHDLRRRLEGNSDIGLHDLAREDGCSRPYVSSMIRLAYLGRQSLRPSSMAPSRPTSLWPP